MTNKSKPVDILAPCPFCGGKGVVQGVDWVINDKVRECFLWEAGCVTCDCICEVYGEGFYHSEEEAIKAWNTRKDQKDE